MKEMAKYIFFLFLGLAAGRVSGEIRETEMFSVAIKPAMFNWTYQEFDKQYTFHTSLVDKPDLPSWLHYVYSIRHHSGFIYGTPPYGQRDVLIQTIALNREDYETRRLVIPLRILRKENIATYQVQLKIDNLNVEDMLDEHRMERLKDIFRKKLWRDSTEDLHTTFMASAIDLGARLPLRPNEGEGVVLRLGSYKNYSAELQQLQEEVRPLSKMTWCPRDFKRTTVERLFRDAGFNLDWCTFKLVEVPNPAAKKPSTVNMLKKQGEMNAKVKKQDHVESEDDLKEPILKWSPPAKSDVPHRSYAHEFTFTIIIPMMAMILLVSVLSLILCFQRDGISDCNKANENTKLQPSRYNSDGSGMTGPNASNSTANLNNYLGDDISNASGLGLSPNNSLVKPRSNPNLNVDYNRPQPPPYLGSNTNSLVLRHRQAIEEDLVAKKNRARTLEESLQLLNEANIVNRNYNIDSVLLPDRLLIGDLLMADNAAANAIDEDYVPIKPEFSSRRANGMMNGSINNNGNLTKGVNGF